MPFGSLRLGLGGFGLSWFFEGGVLFKCKLAIPAPPSGNDTQYVGVSVWGDKAEQLEDIPEGVYIKVQGHLEKHSFKTNCRYCNGPTTVYWTDVVIDNFITVGE